jgi:hypothetical protein
MVLEPLEWNDMGMDGESPGSYEFDHKNGAKHVFANKKVALPYRSVVQNRMKHDHCLLG